MIKHNFQVHKKPHHIHIETTCLNHVDCPKDHWIGGRPERDHPHYVEVDCATGLVGYTRLSAQEIADKAAAEQILVASQEAEERQRETNLFLLRERAKKEPEFAALLRHLGIS